MALGKGGPENTGVARMPVRILSSLFGFGARARRQRQAGESCQSIFLLGNRTYEVEVAGTARFQDVLRGLTPGGLVRGCSFPVTATLSLESIWADESHLIDIAIGEEVVGYCPSYLATRYREWLNDWGLEQAEVQCDATVVKKQCRDETLAVFLDIDPQFRMTAGRVPQHAEIREQERELHTA